MQVGGHQCRSRVVEDERCGKPQSGRRTQAVPQLDGGEGVEAELLERPAGAYGVRVGVSENSGRPGADEVHEHLCLLGLVQSPQPLGERRRLDGRRSRAAPAGPAPAESQPLEQGRLLRPAAQEGRVQLHRYENGFVGGECGVEQSHTLLRRQGGQPTSGAAARARPAQPVDHAAGLFPRAPG